MEKEVLLGYKTGWWAEARRVIQNWFLVSPDTRYDELQWAAEELWRLYDERGEEYGLHATKDRAGGHSHQEP